MSRKYIIYPKNKIATSRAMFQLPLRIFSPSTQKKGNKNLDISQENKFKTILNDIKSDNFGKKEKDERNNMYNFQRMLIEERIKSKSYYENIIKLNKYINELESRLQDENDMNDELIRLRKENEELKLFKQKVYNYSMKYDELNVDIFNCLKSIENAVELFTKEDSNKDNLEYKAEQLNRINDNYKSVINLLYEFMNGKQDEYNNLLMEKDNDIQILSKKLKQRNKMDENKMNKSQNNFKKCKNCWIENKKNFFDLDMNKSFNTFNSYNNDRSNKSCNLYRVYDTNEFDFRNMDFDN